MAGNFKMDNNDRSQASIALLKDIWVQNKIIIEMLLPLYCKEKGITEDEAFKHFTEAYKINCEEISDYIKAEFAQLDIEEIFKDESEA
ncbi:MAG: hypothetical protein ACR2KB_06580 [Chitinophagaceae bacterium]